MTRYFVPYHQENPAAINIKGHRLLIVSTNEAQLSDGLHDIGGDAIREVDVKGDDQSTTAVLAHLAASVKGGVVLSPPGISLSSMIRSLEYQLPWVH